MRKALTCAMLSALTYSVSAAELSSCGAVECETLTGDDLWGCELLLCLANPNGWSSVSECKDPVEKYFTCRAKPSPCDMPTCPQAGDGNYAENTSERFDPCSQIDSELEEAPVGWLASGTLKKHGNSKYNYSGDYWISDGDGGSTYAGTYACVKPADYQGQVTERYSCGDDEYCSRKVQVYSEITWQAAQSSRSIDVYINGELWQRVHW